MRRLLFSQLSRDDLKSLVRLDDHGVRDEPWNELARGELTEAEKRSVDYITAGFRRFSPVLVNEATVWGRAIFPLLMLAETEGIIAQADVSLVARIGDIEFSGSADGAFGRPIAGELSAPFLIVVEAKRGIEGVNPVTQLYGELLAAACLNARETGQPAQRIHGVYTVAATWSFVRAELEGLDTEKPSFSVVSSSEMSEKLEAVTIVKILKSIVAQHTRAASSITDQVELPRDVAFGAAIVREWEGRPVQQAGRESPNEVLARAAGSVSPLPHGRGTKALDS